MSHQIHSRSLQGKRKQHWDTVLPDSRAPYIKLGWFSASNFLLSWHPKLYFLLWTWVCLQPVSLQQWHRALLKKQMSSKSQELYHDCDGMTDDSSHFASSPLLTFPLSTFPFFFLEVRPKSKEGKKSVQVKERNLVWLDNLSYWATKDVKSEVARFPSNRKCRCRKRES